MVIIFLTCGSLSASPAAIMEHSPEERATMITGWMMETLNLNEAAKAQIQDINLKYALMNQEVYNSGGGRIATLKKIKANREAKDLELKGAMTSSQYELYLKKKKELQSELKERMKATR